MIEELKQARIEAITKARASGLAEDHAAAKAAGLALAAAIASGAKECACSAKPHGMLQPYQFGRDILEGFEIGCLKCKDKRVKAPTRELAVEKWNRDEWLKPQAPKPVNDL